MFVGMLQTKIGTGPTCRPGRAMGAIAVLLGLTAAPALAEGLSIGLGSLGEVSVGRDSLADVDVDVGGLDVEAGVMERDTVARGCVGNCDGDGGSVGLSVGARGISASVGSGTAGSGSVGTGGGTGTTGGSSVGGTASAPSVGTQARLGTVTDTQPTNRLRQRAMACSGGGNSFVYNGYPVVDRNGNPIGVVHDTRLSPDLKITGLQIKTTRNRCVGLDGGSYNLSADGRVWVNMDGARLR